MKGSNLCENLPANGPELSCGDEVPQRRNPVRAWQVMSNSSWLFRAGQIVDGWFRQLERLVRRRFEMECARLVKVRTIVLGSLRETKYLAGYK